jgi:dUTP pyrophosphatase
MYMLLKMYIEDEELRSKYSEVINKHNDKMNNMYSDAGFDLFCPEELNLVNENNIHKINLKIKCAAYDSATGEPMSYYLYPRSSISKTRIRLANSVGIIDSGYRGNIMCMVDKLGDCAFTVEKHTRYFQICSPSLGKIRAVLVNTLEELGETSRGEGGFGSTGK